MSLPSFWKRRAVDAKQPGHPEDVRDVHWIITEYEQYELVTTLGAKHGMMTKVRTYEDACAIVERFRRSKREVTIQFLLAQPFDHNRSWSCFECSKLKREHIRKNAR